LDLRKQYPAFGNGSFEALSSGNAKVLAFIRETDAETLLVVANLSRLSQYTELDLSRYRGQTPTELFGQTAFPIVSESPYRLSLGPHGFFWFCLGCRDRDDADVAEHQLPTISIRHDFSDLFIGRSGKLLGEALEPYLLRQRWFAGKARNLQSVNVIDWFHFEQTRVESSLYCLIARANYSNGEPDSYCIPVMLVDEEVAEDLMAEHQRAGIARIKMPNEDHSQVLCEATGEPEIWKQMSSMISERRRKTTQRGAIRGTQTTTYGHLVETFDAKTPPTVHGGEQSNTSAIFAEKFILKLFRRLTPGINPDLEIGRHLTEHELSIVPKVAGALEYQLESGEQFTLGILHEYVPNVGDAWKYTLDELARYFEHVQSVDIHEFDVDDSDREEAGHSLISDAQRSVLDLCALEPPPLAQHTIGGFLSLAELLGQRVGELHVALATAGGGSAFSPEPFTRLYQRSLYQSMSSQARATMEMLRSQQGRLNEESQKLAQDVLSCDQSLYSKFRELTRGLIDARRIRCHGDLHLGQVLFTGTDFVIIDFEGEPERPVSERRIKASAFRDVAGMLRSFHYAANAALRGRAQGLIMQHAEVPVEVWASYWSAWVSASFLRTYLVAAEPGGFLPKDRTRLNVLLRAYLLEKALYELRYEMNNRPDWVSIPLQGIKQYCGAKEPSLIA